MYSAVAAAINHPDTHHPYRGVFNRRMLSSLVRSGTDLEVVSPRPYAPPIGPYSSYSRLPKTDDWGEYIVHHPRFWYLLPKRLLYAVSGRSYARRIPKYVEKTFEKPDLVHACHIYPDGYGMLPYVRENDLPLFVVSHGNLLNSFGDHPPGVDEKIRTTLNAATGVLCVSDALTRKARRLTDRSKVSTVPIGADPDRFPTDQKRRLRRELDLPPDATIILFVGEFTQRKGVTELAEILPSLELEETVFAFVGHGGELKDTIQQALESSQFPSQHVYTGMETATLRRWYAAADLLVLPSHAEGRPTVIYEAMASETAVLAAEVGGIPEQVVDGETGVMIPAGDAGALKTALESLTHDSNRLKKMGKAGLERLYEQNWTWADHAARVQELHLESIEGSSPSHGIPRIK